MIMADLRLFFLAMATMLLTSHGLPSPSTDFRCIFHLSDIEEQSDRQLLIRDLKPKVLSCEAFASTVSDVELTSTSPTSIENLDIDDRVSDCAFLQVGHTCIQIRVVVYVNLNVTHLTARITRKNLSQPEQINITISLIENDSVCESPVMDLNTQVNQSDTCDGSGLVHCEILESPNTTKNLSDPLVIGDMALIRCGRISDVPVFFNIDEVVQNRDSAFTNWSQLILTRTHFIFVLYSPASLSNSVFKITSGRNFPHQCLAKATLINSENCTEDPTTQADTDFTPVLPLSGTPTSNSIPSSGTPTSNSIPSSGTPTSNTPCTSLNLALLILVVLVSSLFM